MLHIARSFTACLSISHPDIDPAEITHAVGLLPKRTTRAGDPRSTPTGEPLSGKYDFSCWMHRFDVHEATELGVILEQLVDQFQGFRSFFHRIVEEGGSVELFCGVFANGNWDESLPYSLLGRLAEFQINLRLDVYPKEQVPEERTRTG